MMTKMPVAGVVWQTLHYLVGFERLGFETYYVEAHARTPGMLMSHDEDDGSLLAAKFIADVMKRFDLSDRWAFHALHDDGRCFGMSAQALDDLYGSAALIINLHGGTDPLPEHSASGNLIYLETDPVQLQVELDDGLKETIEFLEPHSAFFTFGENYGNPDCGLPVSNRFNFQPTRQPVVLDLWEPVGPGSSYSTIGNWRQDWRDVKFAGENYGWSKHQEFLKFLDLPMRSGVNFELALSSLEEEERLLLESHSWKVIPGLSVSTDVYTYRSYIETSRGEFTVAKDQNVRLRSGWFSDRSATYLASGRPVVTQNTGFDNILPTGSGLFAFSTLDEAVEAITNIESDYAAHSRGARDVARGWFDSDLVLGELLSAVGLGGRIARRKGGHPFPPETRLMPISRNPTVLPEETLDFAINAPLPEPTSRQHGGAMLASVIVVTAGNLPYSRLCLEAILSTTTYPNYEIIVVDNGSQDGTVPYLEKIADLFPEVSLVRNPDNLGFAAANNIGLEKARGELIVLLNNDTVPVGAWLGRLASHALLPEIGLVGPNTNFCGSESEIDAGYSTFHQLIGFAAASRGELQDVPMLPMFCVAMRREVFDQVGRLDERFKVGTFEDDDYSVRVRRAGLRVVCARDTFVHHFGRGSFGHLVSQGEYARLFNSNRTMFEEKWGVQWEPHRRLAGTEYQLVRERVNELVRRILPSDARLIVAAKGDEFLLKMNDAKAWNFPGEGNGQYPGFYPADGQEAIEQLEAIRVAGGQYLLFPESYRWLLSHYAELQEHLDSKYTLVIDDPGTCIVYELEGRS